MRLLRRNTSIWFIMLIFVSISCSTSKVVVSQKNEAELLEQAGKYEQAAETWKKSIDEEIGKGNEVAAEVYAHAGKTAIKAGRPEWAEIWFGLAKYANYSDAEMELDLAKIYRNRNEVPKELGTLEVYIQKFAGQSDLSEVNARLFELYCKMRDRQKAEAVWAEMSETDRKSEFYLDKYLTLMVQMKQEAAADSAANELLKINEQHVKAMEWLGESLYQKAEAGYTKEMKAYEKNHTQAQYVQLIQALKTINADYQKSLEYFLILWGKKQKPVYAAYISNIYKRFDDDSKSGYYGQFVDNQ